MSIAGPVAVLQVGNRYSWSFPGRTRKGQVFNSRYGLFHEMDRSESRGDNYRKSGEKICVGQHLMPFRSFRRDSLGQRQTVQRQPIQGLLRLNLDLLEEKRERAAICEAKDKRKMTKYYNARVRVVTFRPGDFVYRSNDASHAVAGGKLSPKWEGPYEVTEALGDGAYKLRSMDGAVLPQTWNIANLKKCYL
ncbi:hypothetical protein Tco_1032205 [Tanacetum coccineum]|uniref:Reverse transcriptase domain-containing protein n=1 Tax=Tanacetum coccineum TaxID=301880 RepID=A0ABQ5GCV3_9ASTR